MGGDTDPRKQERLFPIADEVEKLEAEVAEHMAERESHAAAIVKMAEDHKAELKRLQEAVPLVTIMRSTLRR